MKKFLVTAHLLLLLFCIGCGKKSVEAPGQPATTFTAPAWMADATGKYPMSMTAVVSLPAALGAGLSTTDQLAAFVNDECRGVGAMVKVDSGNVFFVLIQGLPAEQSQVKFKYYSAKTSFMYQTLPLLNFHVDDVYGTAADPKTIELTQLK